MLNEIISNCKKVYNVREVSVIRVLCLLDERQCEPNKEFPTRLAEYYFTKDGRLVGMNDYYDETEEKIERAREDLRNLGIKP